MSLFTLCDAAITKESLGWKTAVLHWRRTSWMRSEENSWFSHVRVDMTEGG